MKVAIPSKQETQYVIFKHTEYERDLQLVLAKSATFENKCEKITAMAKKPDFGPALMHLMWSTDQRMDHMIQMMDNYESRSPCLTEDRKLLFQKIKDEIQNIFSRRD